MASLWIRRLKAQEELNRLKGETLVSDNGIMQDLHVQNLDADGGMHSFGNHLQEASSTKTWGDVPISKIRKLEVKNSTVNKQVYSSEGQSYGPEVQQNSIKQGKGKLTLFGNPHTSSNQKIQIADEEKLPITRCTSEAAVALHTHIQGAESKSQVLHAVRMQAAEIGIATSILGKPPLPPSHKAGLPSRSAAPKLSSYLAHSAGKIFLSSPTNSMVVNGSGKSSSHSADITKKGLPAPISLTGSLLKKGCQSKEDSLGYQGPFSKEGGMCIETRRVSSSKQMAKVESFSQKLFPPAEMQQHGVCHSEAIYPSLLAKPLKKIARQGFETTGVIASGAESSKKVNNLGISERASGTLLKDGIMLKTPSENMVVSSQAKQSLGATVSASTTARFPWEMLAGAAGPTRSAREEFVKIYNRARNELKSQKFSSSIAKVLDKEMASCPNFVIGQATCLEDMELVEHEGQPLDGQLQLEILGEVHKGEVLECAAQHEGLKATATCPQLPQNSSMLEKHNLASFLGGDADFIPEKRMQAFQGVDGICSKESSSFLHGQDECIPAAVGQKDGSSTFDNSSQCRQGFEGAALTHRKPFQAAHLEQTDCVPQNNRKTFMRLGKRQLELFSSGPGIITGKESFQCTTHSRKSDAWLQRWYPPYITSINGSQGYKHSDFDGLGQDLTAGSELMAEESHEHKAFVKEAFKRRLIEKGVLYQKIIAGEQPECSKASSQKVLPSAAAMAIVGTAARNFCMAEPQQKGSFAFWSGFGMQSQGRSPEKGKRTLTFEVAFSAKP